jgi:hypothetical protein
MLSAYFFFVADASAASTAQHAPDVAGVADRLAQLELRLLPAEAGEVLFLREAPIEPRRRDLEALVRDVLDGEQVRQMIAHAGAVLDVHATGLVDEHAHEPAPCGGFAVDELVAQSGQRAFQQFVQLHRHPEKHKSQKKNGLSSPFLLLIGRYLTRIGAQVEGPERFLRARAAATGRPFGSDVQPPAWGDLAPASGVNWDVPRRATRDGGCGATSALPGVTRPQSPEWAW